MYEINVIINGEKRIIQVPKVLKDGDKLFKKNEKWYVKITK